MTRPGIDVERLAVLRVLCKAATQGERVNVWDEIAGQPDDTLEEIVVRTTDGRRVIGLGWHDGLHSFCSRADAAHIAAFDPTTCEALLDAADELGRVREALRVAEDALAKVSRHFEATDPDMREALDTVVTAALRMTRAALVGGKE